MTCYSAICSIPDLGLESEEVIISVDATGLLAAQVIESQRTDEKSNIHLERPL